MIDLWHVDLYAMDEHLRYFMSHDLRGVMWVPRRPCTCRVCRNYWRGYTGALHTILEELEQATMHRLRAKHISW